MSKDPEKTTREEIEHELHIEVVPGTEVMADVLKHHLIKSEHSTVVLVPQPSQDPHDPLNWKASWKWSTLGAVSLMTFSQGFAPLSLASMFPYLIRDYNSNLEDVIQFTGVTILLLGFSNFIWAPISSSFGRRPVFIVSQLVCLASHVLRAKATTYSSFMGACVLNGIGAGPSETLQPQVIADIYFLHDRGRWNTLYWVVYMGSLMIAPVVAGPMADHVGWQNFWWLNVALTAASIVYAFFGFPETRWLRSQPAQDAVTIEVAEETLNQTRTTDMDPYLGKGTPSKQQWYLFQRNSSPLKTIWFDLWTPWKLFGFPIVVFASFVVSWSCSNFLILNLTQSQVFAAPPYNMSSQSIGFTNLAVLVGALIGLVTAGPFSDWVSARATARNNGIREPEMRLPAMIPFVIIMVFGNIITAVGYQNHWSWPIIVVLGYASAGIQVAALPSIASTYAIDCYKPVTGPLMVAITVNKNVWGYGMGKFITPWTIEAGFIPAFMTNMALTVFFCACGAIFYYYGKTFRRWTRNSTVHNL
ncbi:major facilitator superfamily domain-containing protein [Colletotrichum godetiae]|uniref:Major facilitator superfamily domain-containing protein n=2 Tax=Colletotrichum acutatum species complex TaxID=2707335 RepID=A0AAJ0F2U9_9PEZI|nr:major facilitator superfamily domain-containing protein [Colletotrichum godetiae]KAK1701011.1 major facilitator superfamily domain-containing protein [Colletotrichum godetiae]